MSSNTRDSRPRGKTLLSALVLGSLCAALVTPVEARHPEIDNGVLHCAVDGNAVKLSWNVLFIRPIAAWVIQRDGVTIAKLRPSASGYVDYYVPDGEHLYSLFVINLPIDQVDSVPIDLVDVAPGDLSTSRGPIGQCHVIVGDFGLQCRVDGRQVHLQWGPLLIDVAIRQFVIRRNGVIIATVPAGQLSYTDTVHAPGAYRYTVHGEWIVDHGFLVGACTVRVPSPGLICRVDPPEVFLDWRNSILPAVVINQFVIVRDGMRIGTTRDSTFTDVPSPGDHHYVVVAIWGPIIIDDIVDAVAVQAFDDDVIRTNSFIVGECKIFMPGREIPPPEELTCVDIDAPPSDPRLDALELELEEHDVLLVWQKPVEYDLVVITRNDEAIARIDGSQFYYIDRDVTPGVYVYGVIGIVGHQSSDPAKCEIVIPRPPLPPPTDLTCAFVGLTDQLTDSLQVDGFVSLKWENGAAYDWVVIVRNGQRIIRLPGVSQSYRDLNPPAGANHYAVFGVIGLRRSRAEECDVRIPPARVPPPRDLSCVVIHRVPVPLPIDPLDPFVIDPDQPITIDLAQNVDDSIFSPPGVFLRWLNPVRYDRIIISRNGVVIATLRGGSQSHFDPLLAVTASGVVRYEVVGVVDDRRSEAAVCEVRIEPPFLLPPRDFKCEVAGLVFDSNDPAVLDGAVGDANVAGDILPSPVVVVKLTWVNPLRYAALVLSRNGEPLSELPGEAMFYRDVNPPAGEHVYSLKAFGFDGTESREVQCKVEVPLTPVPPVHRLTCVVVETSAQGPTAVLKWKNAADYNRILVVRNGDELILIPGSSEHYKDLGLAPGVYEYQVIAIIGSRRSRAAECRVVVEGSGPRNVLYFSSGLFKADPVDTAASPVTVAGRGRITSMASNSDPVQGWSFGICHDPAVLAVEGATIDDTDTARLNEGAGPSFLVIREFDRGVIMAVVINDMDTSITLPPATDHALLNVKYSGGPDATPGASYPVRYCNTLGEPPVAVLYVVRGFSLAPETRPGFVTLPEPVRPGYLRGDSNSDEEVGMSDSVYSLNYLFLGGPKPKCADAGNTNGDETFDIADPVYGLQWAFNGGRPPPAPFPFCAPAEFVLGCENPTCP